MDWKLKFFVQKTLTRLSANGKLYYFLQRRIGGYRNFNINSKLEQGFLILESLNDLGISIVGKDLLEIGTGWVTIIPMLFSIIGHHSCVTYDIENLLKAELCLQAAKQLSKLEALIKARIPWAFNTEVSSRQRGLIEQDTMTTLLDFLNVFPLVGEPNLIDDQQNHKFDLVFSNETLEHIQTQDIIALLQISKDVLKPNGVITHFIDCSDHYSFSDVNISRINFLQFSNSDWQQYNTKFLYQNRLRACDYRKLFESQGFEILTWKATVNHDCLNQLVSFPLDKQFVGYDPIDICTSSILVIARLKEFSLE